MMKRALIGIASVGILAVTVGVETANAQYYRRYDPAQNFYSQAYTPQSRSSVRREGKKGCIEQSRFCTPLLIIVSGFPYASQDPLGTLGPRSRFPLSAGASLCRWSLTSKAKNYSRDGEA